MKKLILISALLIFACDLFSQNNSLPNWIPADGLYGYWPLDGNINDLSGNENHGTSDGQYSTDTYENGNQSVYLQNQMIILPINSDLNIDNFTVQFWTKAVSYNIHNKVQVADPSGPWRWAINWADSISPLYGGDFLYFVPGECDGSYADSGNNIDNLVSIDRNVWHLLTVVVEGQQTSFYKDGNLITVSNESSNLTCFNDNMNIYFGGDVPGAIEYYNGWFDNIAIWTRALDSEEIESIHYSTTSGCDYQDITITASSTEVCAGESVDLTLSSGLTAGTTACTSAELPANLQTGLVGYWPFCGNANDESGNGNNGTVNGATLTTDRFGNADSAYSFDGDDWIDVFTLLNQLNGLTEMSISFWIKSWLSENTEAVFGHWSDNNGAVGTNCGIVIGKVEDRIAFSNYSGAGAILSNEIERDDWENITVVFDGSNTAGNRVNFYVNGFLNNYIEELLTNETIGNATSSFFGRRNTDFGTYGAYFTGQLDDIAIWNRALTETEIQQLANSSTYTWSTGDTTETISVTPSETTEYWVDVTTNEVTCREYVTINVTAPVAPTGPLTQAFCDTAAVADLTATGENIQWYDAALGGNLLDSNTVLTDGQMVYASQTVNGCESTDRLEVTLSIEEISLTASSTVVCTGETITITAQRLGLFFENKFCSKDEIPITLHDSLLGAWPFCGNPNDVSGNNFNGTIYGGVSLGESRFGDLNDSYIFDGQPLTYVSMGTHESLDITQGSISISCWVDVNNVGGTKTILSKANNDTSNLFGSYNLHINGDTNFVVTNSTNTNSFYSVTNGSPTYDGWLNIIAVADINDLKLRLYIDGLLVSEIDWEGTYKGGLQEFLIGSHYKSNFASQYMYNFSGSIDDVAIWNRVLNQYEVDYLSMTNSSTYTWSTGDTTETISVTPTETTEYWVDVTANSITCREYITINVTDPTAPSGDTEQTFCDASTIADLTATGDNIQWYDAATGGNLLDSTAVLIDGQMVYASQTVNGCESTDRLEVTVSIQDITITASVIEVCAGESVDLSVIGGINSTYLWSTGESNFSGQGTLVDEYSLIANTVSQNTFSIIPGNIYRLEVSGTISLGGGAGNQRDVAYYIQSGPDGTTEGTPFDSACNLRIWTSLFCDTPGLRPSPDIYDASTHTYSYPFTANSSTLDVGFWDSPLGDNGPNVVTFKLYELSNSESTITVTPTETTEYWVDVTTNDLTCRDYITIDVASPAAPTGSPVQGGCSDFTVGSNNNAFTGVNLQWYPTPSGGTALPDSHLLVDGTYYYISQTVDGCESSDRFEFLYLAPEPTITINSPIICEGDSTTVSVSSSPSQGSTTFLWNTGETSDSINLSPTESTTYWVDQIYNSGGPENIQTVCRYFFGITVDNAPEAPISGGDISECETIAAQSLTATASAETGESITWYDASTGGNEVADPSLSAAGTVTYYAEAKNDTSGCVSLTRTAVTLTITSVAAPTGDGVQSFCDNLTVSDLLVTGSNIQWYDASSGGNILDPSSALLDGQLLYASQTQNGCESITRLEVSVEIDIIPDPILITTELEFCLAKEATLADLEIDEQGFALEWYDSFIGGNMLPMDTLLEDGVSYYATLYNVISGCESLMRLELVPTVIPCEVVIYNAISLNDNGLNDYMVIENIDYFPDNSLEIYNRDGHLLYSQVQYGIGGNFFRGKANVSGVYNKNSNLPTGSYLYVFKYFNPYEQQQYTLKGFLTINSN